MNIAVISYHTCPLATLGGKDTGGMNVYVRDLSRFMGLFDVHVDVFTRSQDEHVPHILHDLGCGNRVVHVPAGPETPCPKKELQEYIPEFTKRIIQFTQNKGIQYDLIHSHYWLSGLAGKELKATWGIPLIQMFHTLALLKNKIAKNDREKEGDYRISGEKEVIASSDRIVASTINEKDQLIDLYDAPEEKIEIIPPGVDISRFYPIPPDEAKDFLNITHGEKMLLFVGRIEPLKGIDTLIQSIAQMRKSDILSECPHYLYIIGGDPDDKNEEIDNELNRLRRLCEQLGVGDLIIFSGKKNQDTLQYYYSAAEIVVMPSNYESFGMVALEAMACGTPVIATQVGGLQHLVKDGVTGFTIPHNNPDALEEKISQLICNSNLRVQLKENCVEYARTYAWEVITAKIVNLYRSMIQSSGGEV